MMGPKNKTNPLIHKIHPRNYKVTLCLPPGKHTVHYGSGDGDGIGIIHARIGGYLEAQKPSLRQVRIKYFVDLVLCHESFENIF